jgi:hypothetical protein
MGPLCLVEDAGYRPKMPRRPGAALDQWIEAWAVRLSRPPSNCVLTRRGAREKQQRGRPNPQHECPE